MPPSLHTASDSKASLSFLHIFKSLHNLNPPICPTSSLTPLCNESCPLVQLLYSLLPASTMDISVPYPCPCHFPCLKDIFFSPHFIFPPKPSLKIPSTFSQMIQFWVLSVSSKNGSRYFPCHPSRLWHKLLWSVSSSVSTLANSIYV